MRLERFCVKLHYGTLLDRRLDPSSTQRRLVLTHNHANRGEKCDVTSPSLLTEMAIYIVERWKKVWPTALFLSAIMYREVVHVIFIFCFRFFFGICRTMFWWDPKIILLQQQRDVSLFKKKRTTNPLQFNDLYTKLANSISDVINPYINNPWVWAMYSLTFFRHSSQCLFGHCRW